MESLPSKEVFNSITTTGGSGFRADLLNRKLSFYLSVNDILNWNKTTVSDNNPYYVSNSKSEYNSRRKDGDR